VALLAAGTHPAHGAPSPALKRGFIALALLAAGVLGVAAGLGVSQAYLLAGLIAPFILLLTLVRPQWAVPIYLVLVYADLLSILTEFNNLPAVARFAGIIILSAVVGYRLLILRRPLAADEMTWWLLAYAAVVALGLAYARDTDRVMANLIEFARNFITYIAVINTITTRQRMRVALWLLLAMGVVLASLTLYQSLTQDFTNNFGGLAQYRVSEISAGTDAPRPGGQFGDANYYGQSLLILLPLALYLAFEERRVLPRLLGAGAALILLAAIVYTYSRGDALAVIAMLGAAILYKKPNPVFLIVGGIALVASLPLLPPNYLDRLTTVIATAQGNEQTIYNEASIRGRAGATQAAIAMFIDHPLVGVGRENYTLYELEYISGTSLAYQAKSIPPHDLYLEIAAEHGILGLIVVGGLLLTAWRALIEARRRFLAGGDRQQAELAAWMAIGFFGYLVSSLFLHGAYLYLLWLQVALIIAVRQLARSTPPAPVLPERS
jgi:O-antigen ligase